jgi:hypothetical protein
VTKDEQVDTTIEPHENHPEQDSDSYITYVGCRVCYADPEKTCAEYEADYRLRFKERHGREPESWEIPAHDWGVFLQRVPSGGHHLLPRRPARQQWSGRLDAASMAEYFGEDPSPPTDGVDQR